jgi:nitroimidazol reductase NimA-like FMN-containing flavoprotein (pyridoxamine 5'-phosphate oxidase superfamily)
MTRSEIEVFLNEQRIGRLCMAGADRRPYVLPFPFCWLDGSLYLRVGLTGRKGELLAHNDRVCFEVDAITDTLDDYISVLVEGRLVAVEDLTEKARVKHANDEKYDRLRRGHRPGHGRAIPLAQLPLRKILVEQLTGRRKEPPVTSSAAQM